MRFDSPGHVTRWQEDGTFPAIHDRLAAMIVARAQGRRFVDLCASTGLLGRRLVGQGFSGFAIEARPGVPNAYGPDLELVPVRLGPGSMTWLSVMIVAKGSDVAIARRCLPELQDAGIRPSQLGLALAAGGVRELFIQGRRPGPRAVHALAAVEREVEALAPDWQPVAIDGECAYLRAVGA